MMATPKISRPTERLFHEPREPDRETIDEDFELLTLLLYSAPAAPELGPEPEPGEQ